MTRAEIHFVQSLRHKKYRDQHCLFVAEGSKLVADLRQHLQIHSIYTTSTDASGAAAHISSTEMQRISSFAAPSSVLGVFEKPRHSSAIAFANEWMLALDGVQDPANVGTIIRLCDWFGFNTLLCSPATADCYAPKTVQATMGAIARVRVLYVDLPEFLSQAKCRIYGMFLEGNSIYSTNFGMGGIVVLGSEGQGISPQVEMLVDKKLHIPAVAGKVSESLNVASAASIVCSEIRRYI